MAKITIEQDDGSKIVYENCYIQSISNTLSKDNSMYCNLYFFYIEANNLMRLANDLRLEKVEKEKEEEIVPVKQVEIKNCISSLKL